MKKLVKYTAVAAVILALGPAGASSAKAGGWPVAAGVAGGFAAGAIVSRAMASWPPPAYYGYPPRVYAAPYYPVGPVFAPSRPFCYGPAPVVYPFRYPAVRFGGYPVRRGYFRR
jgi:hypothetical protein